MLMRTPPSSMTYEDEANWICGRTVVPTTKALSELTVAQILLFAKSELVVRSIRIPFSLCRTRSWANESGSVTEGTLKQIVIGGWTDAVVLISTAILLPDN